MITNFWSNLTIYCGNHEHPIEFIIKEGESKFYACPKYMRKDSEHENGYEENELACPNRVSFFDSYKIVEHFSRIVTEDLINGEFSDYTNYKFKYKNYSITVLRYDEKKVKISVVNNKSLMNL